MLPLILKNHSLCSIYQSTPLFFSWCFVIIVKISIHKFIIAAYYFCLFYALRFCIKFHCKKNLAKQFSSSLDTNWWARIHWYIVIS